MGEGTSARTGGGMASLPNLSALDDALVAPTGGAAGRRVGRWFSGESKDEKTIGQFFEKHTNWEKKEHTWGEWWTQEYIEELKTGKEIDKAHHYAYRMAMGSSEKYTYEACKYKLAYRSNSLLAEVKEEGGNHTLTVKRKVKTISKLHQCDGGSKFYVTGEADKDTVHFEVTVGANKEVKSMRHSFQGGANVGYKELTAEIYKLSRV